MVDLEDTPNFLCAGGGEWGGEWGGEGGGEWGEKGVENGGRRGGGEKGGSRVGGGGWQECLNQSNLNSKYVPKYFDAILY